MYHILFLDPELQRGDHLFKADLTEGYYHLRLRSNDNLKLAFYVGTGIYVPLTIN